MSTIADWLASLGMSEYTDCFVENGIDVGILPDLTDQDLKDLGVLLGHRRKMLRAIRELASSAPPTPQPPAVTEARADDAAERRQLTVVFCDLVGSTTLSARLDPEDLRGIITAYHRCCAEVIERDGGFVAKYMGDGVLAYFGYPRAHEDDAEGAVRAALGLVEAVSKLRTGYEFTLQVRVGIATGLAVVGDLIGEGAAREQGVVGETPNIAARLQALAEPGQVVISQSTRHLIGGLFQYRDLGRLPLKGWAEPVQAWQVQRAPTFKSRFEAQHETGLGPLVGREEELELLSRRWRQGATGEGRVVLLSGEPGIGKSRLTVALREQLQNEPHALLCYFCSPHHEDSAFYPIIGQFEHSAGFASGDDARRKLDKLDALLLETETSRDDRALFAELLSLPNDGRYPQLVLDAQQKRQRTLDALQTRLGSLGKHKPVLMIFEDVHWIDATSLELLSRTIERVRSMSVLIVVTSRPEFNPPWAGQSHVTSVILNRLAEREVAAIIARLVGNQGELPPDVMTAIIERTDGIPLFVEEMTKAVLEAEDEGAALRVASAVPSQALSVPASLHASLMARLDRLGAAKEVAQIGAAIGREFSHTLVGLVATRKEADLRAELDRLIEAGLVLRQGIPPESTYLFNHALVRDTAYGTLLREKRKGLHARIAAVLEERFREVVGRQPELLAQHLTAAGDMQRGIQEWVRAGKHAAERSAHIEAIAHFGRALEYLTSLREDPERDQVETEAQLALGLSLLAARGFQSPDAANAYLRAKGLCEKRGDVSRLFAALWGLWLTRVSSVGSMGAAIELSDKLLELTRGTNDVGLRLQAHHSGWTTRLFHGEPGPSCEHCDEGGRLYDRQLHESHALLYGGHDPGACARMIGACAQWLLGYPARAQARVHDALELAQELNHPLTLEMALLYASMVSQFRGEPEGVSRLAQAAETLASERKFASFIDPRVLSGWALAVQGQAVEGVKRIQQAFHLGRNSSAHVVGAYSRTLLAEAMQRAGDDIGALVPVAEAFAERSDACWWDAELYRLKGVLSVQLNDSERQSCFVHSIQIAKRQQARALELRATTSLARLWRDQGKRTQARHVLAPVYGWFTEGFDTLDLKQAKALLDELAS